MCARMLRGLSLISHCRLRRRSARVHACAHRLDLHRLLFDRCHETLDNSFQSLHLAFLFDKSLVLFKELIEQHRIERVVAHRVRLAVTAASRQIGTDLLYFPSNESEAEGACRLALRFVAKAYSPGTVNHLAGVAHRLDFVLKTSRRHLAPEF